MFLACQVEKRCVFAQCFAERTWYTLISYPTSCFHFRHLLCSAPTSKVCEISWSTCLSHLLQSPAHHQKVPGRGRVPKDFICVTNWWGMFLQSFRTLGGSVDFFSRIQSDMLTCQLDLSGSSPAKVFLRILTNA